MGNVFSIYITEKLSERAVLTHLAETGRKPRDREWSSGLDFEEVPVDLRRRLVQRVGGSMAYSRWSLPVKIVDTLSPQPTGAALKARVIREIEEYLEATPPESTGPRYDEPLGPSDDEP